MEKIRVTEIKWDLDPANHTVINQASKTSHRDTGFLRWDFIFFILIFLLIAGTYSTQAQSNFSFKSIKASIKGTSTFHDWESAITKIDYNGDLQSKGKTIKTIKDFEIKIPVESIKSKEGKTMDHKTYEAFKYEENPFITFTIPMVVVKIDALQTATIEAAGNLSMAGTTKPLSFIAKGKVLPNGDLQLTVSQKIKMKEFNMKPPTAVLGTITVGDEVTVCFDLILTSLSTNN